MENASITIGIPQLTSAAKNHKKNLNNAKINIVNKEKRKRSKDRDRISNFSATYYL
jgi:hypothetical protein